MPELRLCPGCSKEYWWPGGRWQHEGCAINSPAINTVAINKVAVEPLVAPSKTANRRSREAYNAYMREYMKRKRAGNDNR